MTPAAGRSILKPAWPGPYTTRHLALQVALVEAAQLRAAHKPVCIIVNDARGELTAARCICPRFKRHLLARPT